MKQLTDLTTSFTSVADSIDLPGQDLSWIQEIRQQALAQFNQSGLPSKKVEDWKYTSLWELTQLQFSHLVEPVEISEQQCEQLALLEDAYRVVIVDGVFSAGLSKLTPLQEGLTVGPFSQSLERVQQQLGQQVSIEKEGLTALNTLLMKEGVMVHIAEDKIIDKPIELLVINTGGTDNLATHLRLSLIHI